MEVPRTLSSFASRNALRQSSLETKKKSHEEGVAVVAEMTSYTDKVVNVLQQEKESQEKERAAYGGKIGRLEKNVNETLDQNLKEVYNHFKQAANQHIAKH